LGKILKEPRRALRRKVLAWRDTIATRSPAWVRTAFGPVIDYTDMLLFDHGIFRLAYLNHHQIATGAWRAAQPAPSDIRRMAKAGVQTIVNLRGERDCGAYRLQIAACERHGIKMEELIVKSRAAPTRAQVHEAQALFARIEHPIVLHCKSGADRAGLASTLYLILKKGVPVEQAVAQLSARYGHFKQADTGIIDAFFQRYLDDIKRQPMPFLQWVDTVYDPDALLRDFKAGRWANIIVNTVLRRE
jgi:protein tyrosine/serine phosphatase